MNYDIVMRHQQALDPSGLSTIGAGLHAVQAAINDCRNAGKDMERDPAVVLLVRHLASICDTRPADLSLRRACLDEIAEIRRHPALKILAYRGVSYDEDAKRVFLSEGRSAMRRLAEALQLPEGTYDVRVNKGGIAVSGEVTLHGEEVWVRLAISSFGHDREIAYRKVRGRADHVGDRNRWASVRDLLAPDRFAHKLRRELNLSEAPDKPTRLFA